MNQTSSQRQGILGIRKEGTVWLANKLGDPEAHET